MANQQQITIETSDGPMPAFEASPDGAAKGGVLVIQEAFGVTTHIENICQRLAEAGWHAVAPAFFHRQGSPVMAYDDFDAVMPVMGKLTADGLGTDVTAALDYLNDAGFADSNIGVVGFCMGGSVTFFAATLRPLGAAATFYGGGIAAGRFGFPALVDLAPSLKTPWLGLFGDQDQGIPVEEVEQLRQATAAVAVETDVVRYPEANHGFNCDDRPAAFHAASAADAWARTLAWFDQHAAS